MVPMPEWKLERDRDDCRLMRSTHEDPVGCLNALELAAHQNNIGLYIFGAQFRGLVGFVCCLGRYLLWAQ